VFRRYGAFAGLFTAAKELKRTPSFEVESDIDSSCLFASEFSKAMHRYGRTCRRDGDSRWGTFRDTEDSNRYLEMFLLNSWRDIFANTNG